MAELISKQLIRRWLGAEQALRLVYEIAASKEEDLNQYSLPFKKYYTFYQSSPIFGFGWVFSNKLPVLLWQLDKIAPLYMDSVLYINVCLHDDGLRKRLQAAVHL